MNRVSWLSPYVEFCEMGVAELGNEETKRYDVIMSGLCFSELCVSAVKNIR
jgi:hypothetical protein